MIVEPGDDGVPNVARIYDYLLGGSHNFAVDRERAGQLLATNPRMMAGARANRYFLQHAVEHAMDHEIRQFLDLGSGIPTVGNVHEIARRRDPETRVAYVDNEPVAVAHSTAILDGVVGVTITDADLRSPEAVLAAPGVADLLDLSAPVALFALAALHFVPDREDPAGILTRYRRALAPGSMLAVTHASDDSPDDPEIGRVNVEAQRLYAATSNPIVHRTRAEIRAMFATAGFTPDARGTVDVGEWVRPPQDEPLGAYAVISEPLQ